MKRLVIEIFIGAVIIGILCFFGTAKGSDLKRASEEAASMTNRELGSDLTLGNASLTKADISILYPVTLNNQQVLDLLTRALEFIDSDKALDKLIEGISDSSMAYPKEAIERYIRMRELRQEIEVLIEALE